MDFESVLAQVWQLLLGLLVAPLTAEAQQPTKEVHRFQANEVLQYAGQEGGPAPA